MIPTGTLGRVISVRAWVPVDDEHTMYWGMSVPSSRAVGRNGQTSNDVTAATGRPAGAAAAGARPGGFMFQGTGTDWYGRHRLTQTMANDYLIDREAQRAGTTYTGIPGILQQDQAVTESMGAVYDRSHEHLGTTDSMIIRTRRRIIAASKALRDEGTIPPGVENPSVYRTRSGSVILPRTADWLEATKSARWPQPEVEIGAPVAIGV